MTPACVQCGTSGDARSPWAQEEGGEGWCIILVPGGTRCPRPQRGFQDLFHSSTSFPSLNFALHQICHFFFQFSIQEESSWKEGSSAALMANCTLTTPSTYFLPLKPMGAFHILLIVTRAVFPPGSCRWPFLPRGK